MVDFIWTLFENVQMGIDAICANNQKVSILAIQHWVFVVHDHQSLVSVVGRVSAYHAGVLGSIPDQER